MAGVKMTSSVRTLSSLTHVEYFDISYYRLNITMFFSRKKGIY